MNMIRKSVAFAVAVALCVLTAAGIEHTYGRQLPEQTITLNSNQVVVLWTKKGDLYGLIEWQMTGTGIYGKDKAGNLCEVPFDNILNLLFIPAEHREDLIEARPETVMVRKEIVVTPDPGTYFYTPHGFDILGRNSLELEKVIRSNKEILLDARRDHRAETDLQKLAEEGRI